MIEVFDAYLMDWPTLSLYVDHAAKIGANAPNDAYLEENEGPFFLVPVCNTTDNERLMAVVASGSPQKPMEEIPELPEVLTVSSFFSIIDGSTRSAKAERLCVFLEVPTNQVSTFDVFPQRLPETFVKMCRRMGLEFLSRQMRKYGEIEAADKMMAEAEKIVP